MKIASLWDNAVSDWSLEKPFSKELYNKDYAHYSEIAEKRGDKLYLAHYSWYKDGKLEKAFTYDKGWKKVEDIEIDGVWDAFKINDETLKLKHEIEKNLVLINRPKTEVLARDKLDTYQKFGELVPGTLKATEENVETILTEYGRAVIKPQDDWGGEGVDIIDDISEFDPDASTERSDKMIVQQFVDSTKGIPNLDVEGVHDLRALLVDGELVTGFVRQPDEGFVSNVHQGGSIDVVEPDKFPQEALDVVEAAKKELEDLRPYLVTVDMIYDSEQEQFKILELNSKPGMSFYGREDMKQAKTKVFNKILDAFSRN